MARFGSLSLASFLILIFSLFCITQCSSQSTPKTSSLAFSITKEEKAALQEFFRDLLFENMGAYVLYGTKPISLACLEQPLSEEEKAQWDEYYNSLSEEERSNYTLRTKKYDFFSNYQKWEEIKHRLPIKQYLFGKFKSRFSDKTEIIIFANIEMTLRILLEFYDDFKRVLGAEFDPFQAVFELDNNSSKFWNCVMDNHALLGILLGYGRDNAWFFEWESKYGKNDDQVGNFIKSLPSTVYEQRDIRYPTPENFMLPIFGSYGLHPNDKLLFEQYKEEQQQIKKLYKGRDEVDIALEWLIR